MVKTTNLGRKESLISRVSTLYYFKCPVSTKNYGTGKKQESVAHAQEKKNQLIKTLHEEAWTVDIEVFKSPNRDHQ